MQPPPRSTLFPYTTLFRSELEPQIAPLRAQRRAEKEARRRTLEEEAQRRRRASFSARDRKSTRLNSSHRCISYAVFCLKKKKKKPSTQRPYGLSQKCLE